MENQWMEALGIGLISAVSLPLGALLSMFWTPKSKIVAMLLSFGGGALLAALTIDLVAEKKDEFLPLSIGCVAGGILYELLNIIVNSKGGFLRKTSTIIGHLKKKKTARYKEIAQKLSVVPLFNSLPADEVQALLPFVVTETYKKGTPIMRQGEKGDSLFIIEKGEVTVLDERGGNRQIAVLKENNVVGELALATGAPRSATVVANTDTKVMLILKENFDHLIKSSPETAAALKDIVSSRLNELKEGGTISREQSEEWINKATRKIDTRIISPTDAEITEEVTSHGGAPLAIWLGILLDGIPESLVIGSSMLLHPVSVSLIAGLFLSNFPEALSSSVGMREQKYSKGKIMLLWSSLMIITGIGALLGNVLLNGASHHSLTFIEGLAAGAMLTMIAETMLPEAFHKGGNVVGLSTLAGFLAAILCGVLSH